MRTVDDYDYIPRGIITGKKAGKSVGQGSWNLCFVVVLLCSLEKLGEAFMGGSVNVEVEKVFFKFYFILFYFILFYFILFYFILFYFILFYFILFYFILFYFILFYFILFYFNFILILF